VRSSRPLTEKAGADVNAKQSSINFRNVLKVAMESFVNIPLKAAIIARLLAEAKLQLDSALLLHWYAQAGHVTGMLFCLMHGISANCKAGRFKSALETIAVSRLLENQKESSMKILMRS
jgi:hypothetical protein